MTNIDKKSSMYIIERGIPLPSNRTGNSKWSIIASQMVHGDSVVVKDCEKNKMRCAITRLGQGSSGMKLSNGNWRIWMKPKRAYKKR